MERMEGSTKYLVPSTLGIGLIEGYNKIGFEKSLSKPQLRREASPTFRPADRFVKLIVPQCGPDRKEHGSSLRGYHDET